MSNISISGNTSGTGKTKICTRCLIEKDFSEYYKRPNRPIGIRSKCIQCQREIDKWRTENNLNQKSSRKTAWKKSGIRITYEEYEHMYNILDGKCEICKKEFDTLCVDHDHDTGKIRGLLCTQCNLGIGNLNDSLEMLSNAVDYLKKHEVLDV